MKKPEKKRKNENNVLYTGRGDDGSTTLFDCHQGRISKSSALIEALGSTDELNAYLGMIKVYSDNDKVFIKIGAKKVFFSKLIEDIQQNLFILQAELGGSKMTINKKELNKIENVIHEISEVIPPLKSFTISGGTILSAGLDYSRTLSRKTERRIISVSDEGSRKIGRWTLAYINRLSSILFAMSRYTNHFYSIPENHPDYNKK